MALDLNNLDPHVEKIAKIASGIAQANRELLTELEQRGMTFDIASAKLEFFLGEMVTMGIVTMEQYWTIMHNWESSLQEQLQEAERRMRHAIAQMKQDEQNALTALVKPPEKRLIVPGHD